MSFLARPFTQIVEHSRRTATFILKPSYNILLNFRWISTEQPQQINIKGQNSNIALVQLNRPKTFNFLCNGLLKELATVLESFDKDEKIACIVLTGSTRVFAGKFYLIIYIDTLIVHILAGADIKEMQHKTLSQVLESDFPNQLSAASRIKKTNYCCCQWFSSGGCELSMMCDIIYAGDKAEFSQPEILIGTIPGAGGTQRLPRYIGKSKAMEMILTGNRISAQEAEKIGLVSAVFPAEKLVEEAIKTAEKIANHSKIVVQLAKEAVSAAFETTLMEGNRFENCLSQATFGLADRKEGMTAFIEKRKPNFTDQ
ncbi:unnamed protein product [Rotaria sp. Silwood2]|nr:unnamed protein product [Rotaria sp. Silwood2]CAF4160727.1 unnamed protein product [Rotaria sp. Silwood2]